MYASASSSLSSCCCFCCCCCCYIIRVLYFGNTSIPLSSTTTTSDSSSSSRPAGEVDGLAQLGPTAVQFIKNYSRSNNYALFDVRPLRIPVYWCSRLGLSTVAPFLTISMRDLLLHPRTASSSSSSSSSAPSKMSSSSPSLRDLLLQVVGSIRAGSGGEAEEEEEVDCSAFRVWGLYPDEVTRASSTTSRRDTAYTRLPDHFAQSSYTTKATTPGQGLVGDADAAAAVMMMSHTKGSVWRLLTRQAADFDTALLLPLFSRSPPHEGGGGGGGCLGLMLESCLLLLPASASSRGGGGAGRRVVWPSDRILGSQQLVGQQGKATAFKIGDSIDVLDGSDCWVAGEVVLIDRVQSLDPARMLLVISVRVPASSSSGQQQQQVIQLLEGSTRVLRAGTITALLLSDEDRCSRYLHEFQPSSSSSSLGIASLLIDSYAASGLPFTTTTTRTGTLQSAALQTIDLYGLAAQEVHLLSRAMSRGEPTSFTSNSSNSIYRSIIGLKLLHLLVLTDGSHLLDSQCRGCAVIAAGDDERTGLYESTAWPRIVAQLHRLNHSRDPVVAFSSHLLGLREQRRRRRRAEQQSSIAAASRRDRDRSAAVMLSRVSNYFTPKPHQQQQSQQGASRAGPQRCSLPLPLPLSRTLAKKKRLHTSRVSAVTVDSNADQSVTAGERQQQREEEEEDSKVSFKQQQQREGSAQQGSGRDDAPHGQGTPPRGVTSPLLLIGVAGTCLPTLPHLPTLPYLWTTCDALP